MAKRPADRFASMRDLEGALAQEEQFLEPTSSGGTTMMVWPLLVRAGSLLRRLLPIAVGVFVLFGVLAILAKVLPVRVSLSTTNPPDLAVRPLPDLAMLKAVTPPLVVPPPILAKVDGGTPTIVTNPPVIPTTPPGTPTGTDPGDGDNSDGPPDKVRPERGQSTKSSHGLVPVRFSIEPGSQVATVICKNKRSTCRGSCQVSIPSGSNCQFTARGYVDRVVRFRELRTEKGKKRSVLTCCRPRSFRCYCGGAAMAALAVKQRQLHKPQTAGAKLQGHSDDAQAIADAAAEVDGRRLGLVARRAAISPTRKPKRCLGEHLVVEDEVVGVL